MMYTGKTLVLQLEGDIRPGYIADLVAFEPDFFGMPAQNLLTTQPLVTVFGGEIVFRRI